MPSVVSSRNLYPIHDRDLLFTDEFLSVLEASGIEAACSTTTTASGLIRGRMVCQLRRGLDGTRWDP
jgi:hypothetical protein